MLDKNIIAYLDNIQIFTKTVKEHYQVIAKAFRYLAHHYLFIEEENCALSLKLVEFLGHIIIAERISVQASKIEAVRNFPQPTTVTAVFSTL